MLAKMAMRNLSRRKFRTTMLVLAMGLTFSVLIFFRGLAEGGYRQMAEIVVRDKAGHVVIEGRGYRKSPKIEIAVLHARKTLRLLRKRAGGYRYIPRIYFQSFLKSSSNSLSIKHGIAFTTALERGISSVLTQVKEGHLPQQGEAGLVIGSGAAKRLQVGVGENVVFITQGAKGPVMKKIPVVGIFHTGVPLRDRHYLYMDLHFSQALLSMPDYVTQIAVYGDITRSDHMAATIRKLLGRSDLVVLPWYKALPMLSQFITYHNASVWLFQGIIFFIVVIIVMNGLLMAVLERTREFGVLRSIGLSGKKCFLLISYEAVFLGILSVAVGLVIGLTAVWYSATYGINPTIFTGGETIEIAGGSFDERIFGEIAPFTVLWTSLALVFLSWTASVLPGIRAAKLHPVRAMRKRS